MFSCLEMEDERLQHRWVSPVSRRGPLVLAGKEDAARRVRKGVLGRCVSGF